MSTSGITFTGLGSGIDTTSIVNQLMAVQSLPLKNLQAEQTQLQTEQAAVQTIASAMSNFETAANALDGQNSFNAVQASSSNTSAVTVTAQNGAQTGNHTIQVLQLAKAESMASAAQSSESTPLGVSGQLIIDGHAVNVSSTDTLQSLVANINSANAGVKASIISTTSNSYTMVLTSSNTGTVNAISISDSVGGAIVQNELGLVGSSVTNNTSGNAVVSNLFSDSATSLGTLIGLTSPQSGTVSINGTGVSIDLATDSLSTIAQKINSAGISGVSANVVSVQNPNGSGTQQQLQLTGITSLTDSNNILANLGIVQYTPTNLLQSAQDAKFTLDNLNITRSSNTISDALANVTINLLSDSGQPTSNVSITSDTNTISGNISNFVTAYNNLVTAVNGVASYNSSTNVAGPLFGNSIIENMMNSVTNIIVGQVNGLSGANSTLAQIGITLDQNGNLNINSSTLNNALQSNLGAVAKIFQAVGTSTDNTISYVNSTSNTKPSGTAGYPVNITQVATQATVTAGTAHTSDNNPNTETLTFTGNMFGNGYNLFLAPNSTLDGIISQINGDQTLSNYITAQNINNQLVLTAKQYGSNYNFSVVSNEAAASNNSGIGTTALNAQGLNVAGTINGEAATGNGQLLTGNSGNATTDGLTLLVQSTTTGSHGAVIFTQGVADQIKNYANSVTDFINGTLTQFSNSLGSQISDLSSQISDMQTNLNAQQAFLEQEFANMDTAVAQLNASAASLASLAGLSGSTSSSSSSGSSGSSSGTSSSSSNNTSSSTSTTG